MPLVNEFETSLSGRRVWVPGHRGMVGSSLVKRLRDENCVTLTAKRTEVDLRCQTKTDDWVRENKPDVVVLAAATVGGIVANDSRPAEFIYDNISIQTNVINAAWQAGVKKLLFLGSSCMYPRDGCQPMKEEDVGIAAPEPTSEWYAIAKIAGMKMCQAYRKQYGCDFISVIPSNLYGPGDNFDGQSSHVIPALIRKFHEAKLAGQGAVEVWGTGTPTRDFMFVADLSEALVFLLRNYSEPEPLNIGTGVEISIRQLATTVAEVVRYTGDLVFDRSKPDGMPRKVLDPSRLAELGWNAKTELRDGLTITYEWFLDQLAPA